MYQLYADSSLLEIIAMKAAMILPTLILQKPNNLNQEIILSALREDCLCGMKVNSKL